MKTLCAEHTFLYVKLASLIRRTQCSFITGAGISTSAGIPDFRSSNGLFQEIRKRFGYSGEEIFTHSVVHSSEEAMRIYIKLITSLKESLETALPTPTHKMLSYLQKKHKVSIYTQNIDGLEKKAGIEEGVYYLHGTMESIVCTHCLHRTAYKVEDNKKLQDKMACASCVTRLVQRSQQEKRKSPVGIMLPDIVLYGGPHDTTETVKGVQKEKSTGLLIVMGTSLKVYGVRNLLRTLSRKVKNNEGIRVYVGISPPPKALHVHFDYWIEGKCDDFSQSLMETIHGGILLKRIQQASGVNQLLESLKRLSIDPSVDCAKLLRKKIK